MTHAIVPTISPESNEKAARIVADAKAASKSVRRRKGKRVKACDRPAYDECHARMLAGRIYTWNILDDDTWVVRVTADAEPLKFTRPEVYAWLGNVSALRTRKPTIGKPASKPTAIRPEPVPGDLPAPVAEWLGRLVYAAKRDYATGYATAVATGADLPADPGADWAGKARRKVDQLFASSVQRAA